MSRLEEVFIFLRFQLERWVLRGPIYRLLLVVLLLALISICAGSFVYFLGASFESLNSAIWWAFLRLTDTGYLGDDQGLLLTSVSTVITIAGAVLFLGALIAIMTQWFQQMIHRLEAGLTTISQKNHILILGWSNRSPIIVKEIFQSEGRIPLFLRKTRATRLKLVLLSEQNPMEVQQLLQDTFVQNWRFSGLIFRSGNHLKLAHLERVATMDAAVIVLPSAREDAGLDSTVDGGTFKSLLTIGNWAKRESRRPPLAVAEILDHRKSDIAQVAYGGPLEIIPSDLYLSRLMAQILRHPGSSEVFSELLSEDIGNELYLKDSGTLIGQPFSRAFEALKTAIPIGIVSQGPQDFFCTLVPEPDHILCENDKVVVIAEDDIKSQLSEVDELKPIGPLRPPIQSTEKKLRNILILGWNRRVPLILNEFECYSRGKTTLTVLSRTPLEARLERQSHMGLDFKSVQVSHILGDYTSTTELKTYQPGSFDAIVLVASDWSDTDALTDARTILGYLVLMELLDKHRVSRPAILVELLDASNQDLFSQENCEVIVSPLIVSHILSQVALRRELNTVFENLFCPEGAEVTIVPATSILGSTLTTSLEQVQEILFGQGGVSLGFQIHEKRQIKTVLNPPRKQEFQLEINDKIIILFR